MKMFHILPVSAVFLAVFILLGLAFQAKALAQPVSRITHVTILHTNDTHGYLASFDSEMGYGIAGAAGRATLVNEIRKMNSDAGPNHHTLLLDAGDVLENNPMSNFFKGEADFAVMNQMRYDALTFGNHDFGFGMDVFLELEKTAGFPVLSANIVDRATGRFLFKPYVVKRLGRLRAAIFGLTSDTIFYNTSREDLARIEFTDPDEAYLKILPEIKKEADVIIFLSHLGADLDRKFAAAHPEVTLIVGGHSHTFMEKPEKIGETYIVQAGKFSECLGRVDLTFVGTKLTGFEGRLINIADRKVSEIVKKYRDRLDPEINVKIGDLKSNLENMNKFESPTPLFGFVLKNLKEYAGADFAMETSASLSSRLTAGPILLRDIYRIMPYNNFVVRIKMKGSEIKKLMDYSASKKKSQAFIQTFGLAYGVENGRAVNITIGGKPLEPARTYLVATDNYMSAGGAEDGILKNIGDERKEFDRKLIRDVVIENIRNGKAF